jgi:hypothetical protein
VYTDGSYSQLSPLSAGANVDAGKDKTGVCGVNGTGANPWSVDDNANGAEELDFTVGSNPNMGSSRLFSEAVLQIANGNATPATVTLVETLTGTPGNVGTQTCTIPAGSTVPVDTNGDAACPNTPPNTVPASAPPNGNFDTLKIRVPDEGDSVSVVGPSSQFLLAKVICGGHFIQTTPNDPVQATLSLTGSASQCKTYTTFSSSIVQGQGLTLSFNGFSTSSVQFTVQITWPLEPLCQPYSDPQSAANPTGIPPNLTLPVCAVHHVQINGVNYDQTSCPAPETLPSADKEPQAGLCTANKQYNDDSTSINAAGETATPLSLASTTVASLSSGVDVSSFTSGSPGTLNVASSALFPPSGNVLVATSTGSALLSYTGTGTGTLTGVVLLSGTGTLATGNSVIVPATQVVETWVGFIDWGVW